MKQTIVQYTVQDPIKKKNKLLIFNLEIVNLFNKVLYNFKYSISIFAIVSVVKGKMAGENYN